VVVGANAVVTRDIPPYAIVAGVPAKIIRLRFSEAIIERLQSLRWWRFAYWDLEGIQFDDIEKALDQIQALIEKEKIQEFASKVTTIHI